LKNKTNTFTIPQLLLSITLITFVVVFIFVNPIPQDANYHHFANDKVIFGIANFWNVLSNIGFLITGLLGINFVRKNKITNPIIWILFAGIILTGIGSAYYHYNPNNITLVWDRLPMTIVFTSFFALIYAWCFNEKMGFKIWLVSLAAGIYSVFYWQYTEHEFRGDLRLYAIIQFLPIVLIIIILASHFKSHSFLVKPILMIIVWYIIAKLLEHYDSSIFKKSNLLSGHPAKHIAAAMATYYIFKMIKIQITTKKESFSIP
jgi:Ceramidase